MSTSSSSQAPLVIDENEPKHGATILATTSGATSAQCLPPPRFPKRLACVEVNTMTFEQGFDEQWVEGGIANHVQCAICQCLPRRPATLDGCGHIFCERCIKQHFVIRSAPQVSWSAMRSAPCPNCRQPFRMGEILTWPAWQRWAQLAFNAQVVHCPYGCPFSGSPAQTDDHQARVCPRRIIACPVEGCQFTGPAAEVEGQHFPTCPLMRVHCRNCRLPVRVSKMAAHDCVRELKAALKSM